MEKLRKILSNAMLIHAFVLLGLAALLGYIETGNKYLVFFTALSFAGAFCGSFIKLLDAINKKK